MNKTVDTVTSIIEQGIKGQLVSRLAFLGGPISGITASILMKYVITPALDETEEAIEQQVNKYHSRQQLKEVNDAENDSTFTDAFEHI